MNCLTNELFNVMNRPGTAILCIARNESPFTAEWLEYHFKLGFDRIYFVSTDASFGKIEEFFERSEFRSRIELFHFDDFRPGWQMGCYNTFFPLVKEEWVLVLDIDEYLFIHEYPNIHDFLDTVRDGVGQIQFPWLILMSESYCHDRTFDILEESGKFVSDHMKSMVRRSHAAGLGIHSHGIRHSRNILSSGVEVPGRPTHDSFLGDIAYYRNHPFVLHFCSRGHFDVLNRIIDHQFFNGKNGEREKDRVRRFLTIESSWENLPTRYLLMQFYRSLPRVTIDIKVPKLKAQTDVQSLSDIFYNNITKVVDFDCPDPGVLDTEFERRFQLVRKLAQLDLSGKCNHDDYLACSTQLEYIGKLRKYLASLR